MYLRSYLNSQEVMELIDHIVHSDFVESMKDGTLEDGQFRYYLRQENIYLKHYKAAGSIIGKSASDSKIRELYNDIGAEEPEFHRNMLKQFGVPEEEIKEYEINYTTYSYINHLIRWSKDSSINGMLSMFPCQWSYGYIAEAIPAPSEKFKFWFDFYRSKDYRSITDRYLEILGGEPLNTYQEQIIWFGLLYEFNYWKDCYIKIK
ncbi:MAG: TenA family protein [Candidatus Thermoplasmatota archaeon]|jgi:thiaminase/transcriptional activator TenA|uniref:TenA family protein n=1 Tax=Ferroplasma sp. TaxID=2591003 RepID=UPI00262CA773|nr:TenA family protein [Ferroplasma sp.]MCL4311299.1 TenA family protein [Candidatus Thermoplasmatota archaeon]